MIDYLDTLDVDGLKSLQANLDTMHRNGLTNIRTHRENEARIVAGRFIEDQTSYRTSVLATNQHDPDWKAIARAGTLYGSVRGAARRRRPGDRAAS